MRPLKLHSTDDDIDALTALAHKKTRKGTTGIMVGKEPLQRLLMDHATLIEVCEEKDLKIGNGGNGRFDKGVKT